jgi:hypothetical protein
MTLRGAVRSFVKETNLDTYQCLCQIYDLVAGDAHGDDLLIRAYAKEMRKQVDYKSLELKAKGEALLQWLEDTNAGEGQQGGITTSPPFTMARLPQISQPIPYSGLDSLQKMDFLGSEMRWVDGIQPFGLSPAAIPYTTSFKEQLAKHREERG